MQTIKTALLVVFMMVILYGAYVILYTAEATPDGFAGLLNEPVTSPETPAASKSTGAGEIAPLVLDSEPPTTVMADAPLVETPAQPLLDEPLSEEPLSAELPGGLAGQPEAFTTVLPAAETPAVAVPPVGLQNPGLPSTLTTERDSAFPTSLPAPAVADDSTTTGPETADLVSFRKAWELAKKQVENGQFREGLLTLSVYHGNESLPLDYKHQLINILDYLAGEVIYSQRHMIEPPYTVGPGESLQMIAHQYRIPVRLLQNINGIRDPVAVVPGSQLKVVRGPFRAVVDLSQSEITLFAGQYYAGRIPCSFGVDPTPETGQYSVLAKQQNRSYYLSDGSVLPGGDRSNPYGRFWMDLGNNICLHGRPATPPLDQDGLGCIGMGQVDAADVYGILTAGSQVRIQR
jgi:lipoprotein-anchoring transpeptidase ErfK/SrfK